MTLKKFREETSSDEYPLWMAYEELFGFPVNRLTATTAIAGSAIARSMGNKITANQLLPIYEEQKISSKLGKDIMDAWAISHNNHIKKSKAIKPQQKIINPKMTR